MPGGELLGGYRGRKLDFGTPRRMHARAEESEADATGQRRRWAKNATCSVAYQPLRLFLTLRMIVVDKSLCIKSSRIGKLECPVIDDEIGVDLKLPEGCRVMRSLLLAAQVLVSENIPKGCLGVERKVLRGFSAGKVPSAASSVGINPEWDIVRGHAICDTGEADEARGWPMRHIDFCPSGPRRSVCPRRSDRRGGSRAGDRRGRVVGARTRRQCHPRPSYGGEWPPVEQTAAGCVVADRPVLSIATACDDQHPRTERSPDLGYAAANGRGRPSRHQRHPSRR